MGVDLKSVEWYDKSSRSPRSSHEPEISINRTGRVSINNGAMRLLGEIPESFLVGYSREGNIIVLKPATNEDAESYRLSRQGRTHYINTKRFLEEVGYRAEKLERFPAQYDQDSNVLYFSLNDVIHDHPKDAAKPRRGRPKKNPE